MAWYRSGTIALTNGSTTVTGTGTQFLNNVKVGDIFIGPDGLLYEIASVVTSTEFDLQIGYAGTTVAGAAYQVVPTTINLKALAQQIADLITLYNAVPQAATDAENSAAAAAASASAGATSEANAKASGDTAAASAATLQAALLSFNKVWLGALGSDPATDNNGNALQEGAMYENTSTSPAKIRIFHNGDWQDYSADAEQATSNAQLSATNAAASEANAASSASAASGSASAAASYASQASHTVTGYAKLDGSTQFSGNQTIYNSGPTLTVHESTGNGQGSLNFASNGTLLWSIFGRSRNAGQLWGVSRFDSTGYLDIPFSIDHGTSVANFTGRITTAGATDDGTNALQIGGNIRMAGGYPTINFGGSGTPAIWTPAGQTLAFTNGNGEVARMTPKGDLIVGGTGDNGERFQVDGNVTAYSYMIGSNSAGDAGITGFATGYGPAVVYYGESTSGAGSLAFRVGENQTEAARVTKRGGVVVGQITDDNNSLLQVGGTIRATGSSRAFVASNGGGAGQTSMELIREGAATDEKAWEVMVDDQGGFVIRTLNDAYSAAREALKITRPPGGGVEMTTMQLMGNEGRVLVGPTSDDGKNRLQIDGAVRASNFVVNTETTGDAGLFGFSNSNGPSMVAYGTATAGVGALIFRTKANERARITADGRLLIASTADNGSDTVQVAGTIRASSTVLSGGGNSKTAWINSDSQSGYAQSDGNMVVGSASSTGVLVLTGGNTEAARIPNTGNLLIATTTDNQTDKLQVNGTVSAKGLTTSGDVNVHGQLNVLDQQSLMLSSSGYHGYLRADSSGFMGFINQAANGWLMQLYDDGHVTFPNYISTQGYLQANGSTYISTQGGYLNTGGAGTTGAGTWAFGASIAQGCLSGQFIANSDRRIKTDVVDIDTDEAVAFVKALEPKHYVKDGRPEFGFIAQDVVKAFPNRERGMDFITLSPREGVAETTDDDGFLSPADHIFSLDNAQVDAVAMAVIKNLLARVESLEAQLAAK